jgi:hypothetical protein
VRRSRATPFERGWVNHNPPIGYLLDSATKTIIKDPDRFDLVRRMWDLLLTGTMRPELIRRIANEQWGLRTRGSARARVAKSPAVGVPKNFERWLEFSWGAMR